MQQPTDNIGLWITRCWPWDACQVSDRVTCRRLARSGAGGRPEIDAAKDRATLEPLQCRRHFAVLAIFGHQLGQSLDVAARRRREGPDQGVEQRRIDHEAELVGHHPPYLPPRLVIRRVEFYQCDAARD